MNLHSKHDGLEAKLGRLQPLAAELNREEFYFRAGQEAENARRAATNRKWVSVALGSMAATLLMFGILVTQRMRFDRQLAELRSTGVPSTEQAKQLALPAASREPDPSMRTLAAELALRRDKTNYFHSRRQILKHAEAWEMTAVDRSAGESQVWQPRDGSAQNKLRRHLEIELLY